MSGQYSSDGKYWWDGTAWHPSFSADGRWRWDGTQWVRNRSAVGPFGLRVPPVVALWLIGGMGAAIALASLLEIGLPNVGGLSGQPPAFNAMGVAFLHLCLGLLMLAPLAIRYAYRYGVLTRFLIGISILLVVAGASGIALYLAFPVPAH